jgi:gamma-glutamyl:cysteine ligase YbdK (ATP-grasp superfamily)
VGIPPYYRDGTTTSGEIAFMVGSGVMDNYTDLRHDVRPHPTLGAVEARVCDRRTRVERTPVPAELIQAMVRSRASPASRAPALELSATDADNSCQRSMDWTARSSILPSTWARS